MSTEEETIFRSPYPDIDIPNVSVPQYILETISKHDQFKPAFIDGTGDKRVITFAQYGALVKKVNGLRINNIIQFLISL